MQELFLACRNDLEPGQLYEPVSDFRHDSTNAVILFWFDSADMLSSYPTAHVAQHLIN